jgi:hypothetical protein
MVHIDCAAREEPQLFVSDPKGLSMIGPIAIGVIPLFVTVTGCGTPTSDKLSDEGERVTELPV